MNSKVVVKSAFLLLALAGIGFAQSVSSSVEVVTVFSENGRFRLVTVPYDSESPTARGRTSVYRVGVRQPLYIFERGFDGISGNELVLSNDGNTVFFLMVNRSNDKNLRPVMIYRRGELFKTYSTEEITGCDLRKERCRPVYFPSAAATKPTNEEVFLNDFAVFSRGDRVFLTDTKLRTHTFDLQTGEIISSQPFTSIFAELRRTSRKASPRFSSYDVSSNLWKLPRLSNGEDAGTALARCLGMTLVTDYSDEFRTYGVSVSGMLSRDGRFAVEFLESDKELPREKISGFFKSRLFSVRGIPSVFPKWFFDDIYFRFRKSDRFVARRERQEEIEKQKAERKKRLVAERIADIYIPNDLGDCFKELDRLLSQVDRDEMRAEKDPSEMFKYHFGLGMWIRNNWGLWGGSRLQKYFTDRGVTHPDDMSSVILYFYYDWLNGNTESWKTWDSNPTTDLLIRPVPKSVS